MDEYNCTDGGSPEGQIVCDSSAAIKPNMIVEDITCHIVNAATNITLSVSFCKIYTIHLCA